MNRAGLPVFVIFVRPEFSDTRPVNRDYGLVGDPTAKANLEGNIVSVLQAGCFFGAIFAYPLTDIFGRKWCLVSAALLTLVGVVMQAAASGHIVSVYVGRAIAGMPNPPYQISFSGALLKLA